MMIYLTKEIIGCTIYKTENNEYLGKIIGYGACEAGAYIVYINKKGEIRNRKEHRTTRIFEDIKIVKEDLNILFPKIKPQKITRAQLIDLED